MFDRPLSNDIDNVNQRLNNNVIDNVVKRTASQVDSLADRMMAKLHATDNRDFYCKVGWKLSEAVINNNLELAVNKGKDPQRYFSWLCKRVM